MALINTTFKSIALGRNVSFTAVLPVDNMDYLNERNRSLKGPYKTLYLLNGLYGDCTEWLTHTDIKRIAERNNLAVIMPSGENSFYRNHIEDNRLFSTYIGVELVDITRDMFNLSNKKEDTFIGGYSMGGYGALYNGFKYNNRFSKIIALSPALILENKFDKDNKSSFFGCQIAEYKAFIKYANKQIFVQKEKVKMLKQTYKEMSEIYNFNVKSREAVFLRKKIEREENILNTMQKDREAVVFAMQQLIANRDKTLASLKDRKEKND